MASNEALHVSLLTAVPLYILEIKEKGGPDEADYKAAREASNALGERGDVLLFGGSKHKGEIAELFNSLAHAIAVLAFCPGGVTIFREHWEA